MIALFIRVLLRVTVYYYYVMYASGAVVKSCSVKKAVLEISQNSQENACARLSFLKKGLLRIEHREILLGVFWKMEFLEQAIFRGFYNPSSRKLYDFVSIKLTTSRKDLPSHLKLSFCDKVSSQNSRPPRPLQQWIGQLRFRRH